MIWHLTPQLPKSVLYIGGQSFEVLTDLVTTLTVLLIHSEKLTT